VADGSSAGELCSDLARRSGLSKTRIKLAMARGAVWIAPRQGPRRRVRRATARLTAGDRIDLYYDAILDRRPPEARLIDDRQGYAVWFKPAGMLNQGAHFGDHCSQLHTARNGFNPQRKVFAVHRLDREAQGLILVAHRRRIAAELSIRFQRRQVKKQYRAVVQSHLPDSSEQQAIATPRERKTAFTRYRLASYDPGPDRSTVDIWIETGRRHQIRRHFDGIGHPLARDPRYGTGNQDPAGLQLWATRLEFSYPVDRKTRTYCLPESFGPGGAKVANEHLTNPRSPRA
jgi:tRNA pseudouridine32 synthase/23S rRNA pseudouridine746 synthase